MLNFAVGPVTSSKQTLDIGGQQVPYFRTIEFSAVMKENEALYKKLLNAPENARALFITGSGTASMEAAVLNTLTKNDRAIVVNGGSFGERFCEILSTYAIPYEEIICEKGKTLTKEQLVPFENGNFTAFLVNLGETSTGVLYDIDLIASFCRRNNLFLIVDCISSFLCDEIDMKKSGADIIITGSQKALALAPGLSLIALSERAEKRIADNKTPCFYLDLKRYLKDGERGQTPFTPAVGILLQLNARLKKIDDAGGQQSETKKAEALASYFRNAVKNLPLSLFADKASNAVTSLAVGGGISAYGVFETLKDRYGIFACPNGGELKDKVFRIGHMGDLKTEDYDKLIIALKEILK